MFNLISPDTIQSLLKKHNFAPNKFLGQNFLIDEEVLEKIMEAADIKEGDNVIEIGPGLGVLTQALLAKGANVVAIEKDKDLIPVLEENLQEFKNFKIVNDDFLKVEFAAIISDFSCHPERIRQQAEKSKDPVVHNKNILMPRDSSASPCPLRHSFSEASGASLRMTDDKKPQSYKVVSNIPYYITSPVLRKILTAEMKPEEIVFLVQREVAERISAKPGEMSVISVFVQFYGTPSVVQVVKPESFWPAPKVESAILKIVVKKDGKSLLKQSALLCPAFTKVSTGKQGFGGSSLFVSWQAASKSEEETFWRLVKIGYSSRRKTLANNLAAGFHTKPTEVRELLKTLGFTDKTRAQELSVEDWLRLFKENC